MKTNINEIIDDKNNIYNMVVDNEIDSTIIGISPLSVRKISEEKHEPSWGSDLSDLDLNKIKTYVKPSAKNNNKWDNVPKDIKNVFDALGIPEAEKKYLAGVGTQFDSEPIYHNLKDKLVDSGVIYTDFDTAIKEYPELIKKYFTKAVPINDHKYIALHYALFSGGSFVYVPKNVKLDFPIQSYFRLNSKGAGQF